MPIRRLTPDDAAAFQDCRLEGLRDTPSAFGSSFDEERHTPLDVIAGRLAPAPDQGVFGAFDGPVIVGLAALGRERMVKLSHKAFLWGVHVRPPARRQGLARALVCEALALAAGAPGVQQVNLCVNAGNAAALRLYESLGFVAWGHEHGAMCIDGVLHGEIHMVLRLRPN